MEKRMEDQSFANDFRRDNNNISTILYISYVFKSLRLIILIFMLSYFIGCIFYICSDVIHQSRYDKQNGEEDFIEYFGIDEKDGLERIITMTYFGFTSLTTVGFGDYHPRHSVERVLTVLMLIFGVSIFSYIMGIFINIVDTINSLNASIDDGENLVRFFGLLIRFNKNKNLNGDFRRNMEQFFDFKWTNGRLLALESEADKSIF